MPRPRVVRKLLIARGNGVTAWLGPLSIGSDACGRGVSRSAAKCHMRRSTALGCKRLGISSLDTAIAANQRSARACGAVCGASLPVFVMRASASAGWPVAIWLAAVAIRHDGRQVDCMSLGRREQLGACFGNATRIAHCRGAKEIQHPTFLRRQLARARRGLDLVPDDLELLAGEDRTRPGTDVGDAIEPRASHSFVPARSLPVEGPGMRVRPQESGRRIAMFPTRRAVQGPGRPHASRV